MQFYQASLTASDIDKLVRFEVLSYGEQAGQPVRGGNETPSKVNWDLLERRIASSEKGLPAADHPAKDRRTRPVLRAVPAGARSAVDPGAVIISCDEKLTFEPRRAGPQSAPEGARARRHPPRDRRSAPPARAARRHRQLRRRAVHRAGDHLRPAARRSRRPDVRHDQREAHAAERVAPGVSLSGRQLYRDEALAAAHDVVRALNDREDSPLHGEIKLLGVGQGRVAQAPLAQELKKLFAERCVRRRAKRASSARNRRSSS